MKYFAQKDNYHLKIESFQLIHCIFTFGDLIHSISSNGLFLES